MVATKFCRRRLMVKPVKDKIREMMIASANSYTYTISLSNGDLDVNSKPAATQPPRKRRRLDSLTPEEKLRRKKLKNREAAQTSRDKKKAYVTHLEETLKVLKEENDRLACSVLMVTEEKEELAHINETLRRELEAATGKGSGPRPAVPSSPLQKELRPLPKMVLSSALPLMWTLMWIWRISNGSTTSRAVTPTLRNWEKSLSPSPKKPSSLRMKNRHKLVDWWGPSQKAWNPLARRRPPKKNQLLTS